MEELGIAINEALTWFSRDAGTPFVLIHVSPDVARNLPNLLRDAVRRCYIADEVLVARSQELAANHGGTPESCQKEVISSKLPDPGSTMSGDFGEIMVFIYQSVQAYPKTVLGAKKWRLKQDRTKPAPYSDVIHFVLPHWPNATAQDELWCAEVKCKATASDFSPIQEAIKGCLKDRTSRLSRSLQWLKERALGEDLGKLKIEHLDRFIKATEFPPVNKRFSAVAVIDSLLLDGELENAPKGVQQDYTLVIAEVPGLYSVYGAVFDTAKKATLTQEEVP